VDRFIYWQTHGEWRLLDAPWEGVQVSLTAEQEAKLRSQFLESCALELPSPRKTAVVSRKDNRPLGWVTRYGEERTPDTWMVGIDICEDDTLNKGLGTEALGLWLDYLFANSTVHRIGLDTWSFNPRMSRVAGKLGFIPEGVQRGVLKWDGQWLDLVHFGMLRAEWEERLTNKRKM
jgi:RimJ/RimL family protein N-acetyltransferase